MASFCFNEYFEYSSILSVKENPMRNVLSEDERRRITAGKRAEGKAEGRADVKADTVRIVMPKLNMSASEAMTFLEIPESERSLIQRLLRKQD